MLGSGREELSLFLRTKEQKSNRYIHISNELSNSKGELGKGKIQRASLTDWLSTSLLYTYTGEGC